MQYQSGLLDGFIAETGLIPVPPWRHPEPKTSVAGLQATHPNNQTEQVSIGTRPQRMSVSSGLASRVCILIMLRMNSLVGAEDPGTAEHGPY